MLNRKNKITPTDADKFPAADTLEETLRYYHLASADFAKQNRETHRQHLKNL